MDKSFPFFYPNSTPNYHNSDHSDKTSSNNNPQTRPDSADRDYMFEKPLTPSDVGKLNRLVIPKQHAERYFPLAGGEKTAGAGGVLLRFEDETGKCWRFRYSYWNSSQSYVLTKGWSRYVKEKKLESGDVVLFERFRNEPDRFFIGWRRRRTDSPQNPVRPVVEEGWTGGGESRRLYYNAAAQVHLQGYSASHPITPYPYHPDSFHAGTDMIRQGNEIQKTPKRVGRENSKTLRLFGVNLECHVGEEDEDTPTEHQTSDGSSFSSHESPGQGSGHGYIRPAAYDYRYDYVDNYPPTNLHNQYMGMM